VHLRRAILLFALILGLTALAAAVSPSREMGVPVTGPPPAVAPSKPLARTVTFPPRPVVRVARAGEHLVLSVASAQGGLMTIPRLGRTATVSPDTPALFNLLAPPAGRYDVLFAASPLDEPRLAGTLVTRP
jgi:hypothetical protein